ncbi:MAG: adaptor protein MecA [Clostridia bacterium]
MKVEKISENKVKITLSIDELNQRNITLKDIEKDSVKAKNLFLELIEESNLESNFVFEHAQLFVEATTDSNDFFTVTITKVDDFPDLSKYNLIEQNSEKTKSKRMPALNNDYTLFNVFCFDSLDTLVNMCDILKSSPHFLGKNSLLKYDEKYFLIFSKYSIKNIKFLKTYSILSEFSINTYEGILFETSLKEKGKIIIKDKALQNLIKI